MIRRHLTVLMHKLTLNQWLWFYLLASLLVAAKVTYNQHGWLNTDSLLYFEQARLIANSDWQAAFKLFSWILYPSLIALLHVVSGLDIHTSAQVLNIVFFLCFVRGFQYLLLEAGGTLRTLHWGHLLLLSTPYIVGDVFGMLLRDEGFWVAYVWGLVYFLRFTKSPSWKDALLFQLIMGLATLFRIEAVAYLIVLPLLVFLSNQNSIKQRFIVSLKLYIFPLFASLILAIALMIGTLQEAHLGRLKEIHFLIINLFTQRLDFIHQKADIMASQVLGGFLDDYARISLWWSLLLIVFIKILKVAGYPALLALIWRKQTWWSKLPIQTRQLALATLLISFIVAVVIILNVFVLSSRYVISAGIIMLMLASFAMADWQQRWPTWLGNLIILTLGLLLINNLVDRSHPDLDRLAVNYVASINKTHQPVLFDTENARFYAGKPYLDRISGYDLLKNEIQNGNLNHYEIIVLTISYDEQNYASEAISYLESHRYKLMHTLYGWRKKSKALIYAKTD